MPLWQHWKKSTPDTTLVGLVFQVTVTIVGPKQYGPDSVPPRVVNTTSRSKNWSQGLSPFYCGPVPLYPGAGMAESRTVENAWQYSKVYPPHVGPLGDPTPDYFRWAQEGWSRERGDRYPMGKSAKPAFSWWAGESLGCIEARKKIYIPLYAKAVLQTEAFAQLLGLYKSQGEITLWDFDGYGSPLPVKVLAENPNRPLGHAFILKALLGKLHCP